MIDFWGILGNAATDDTFRNAMYNTFKNSTAVPNPDPANTFSCMFADSDYDAARSLVVAKMGMVSLMALGEWFVVSVLHPTSRQPLDNIAGIVQPILGTYRSTNPIFYQTLGASIVDAAFRAEFAAGNEAKYGFQLSTPDRAALAPVIGNGAFGAQSGAFHAIPWGQACKDMVIQSPADPYAHALEAQFQP